VDERFGRAVVAAASRDRIMTSVESPDDVLVLEAGYDRHWFAPGVNGACDARLSEPRN
jgi:hypothetical protein